MNMKTRSLKDLKEQAERACVSQFSFFLDPKECFEAQNTYREAIFWGGYDEAERKMVCFPADWDEEPVFPIHILHIRLKNKKAEITHRDCLGALMHLGMDRACFGDLVKTPHGFIVFTTDAAATVVQLNLEKIGREGVVISEEEGTFEIPERKYKEESKTVASARLDCVVAAFLNVSRSKAMEYLRSERVTLNYITEKNPDKQIKDGDIMSVRGHGKARLHFTGDVSKKGRMYLVIHYYI